MHVCMKMLHSRVTKTNGITKCYFKLLVEVLYDRKANSNNKFVCEYLKNFRLSSVLMK